MPLERTPERSKRVAIGESILAVVLVAAAAVTGIWFAYIVAAAALLLAAFVWVRASPPAQAAAGWKVDQLPDGTFRWTAPSGRQYATERTRYPI